VAPPKETKPKKRKNLLWILLILLVAIAITVFLIKSAPRPKRETVKSLPPLVEVIEAQETSEHMTIHTYGTVRSGETLSITAEVRGKIVEMAPNFEDGVYFPKGAFLMRIDPQSYQNSADRLRAELQRLDAETKKIAQERNNFKESLAIIKEDQRLAKAEYDRNLSLSKRKVVSQTRLDQSRQQWLGSRTRAQEIENALALIGPRIELLKAQRSAVSVQLKEARLDLERTEINAPFDCRVSEKPVEAGQYVNAGIRLARVYNVRIMEVEVRIPPRDVAWLHFDAQGPQGAAQNNIARARITYDASGRKLQWDGFVARIKGQMDERTRTLPVVVQISNSRPGTGHPIMPGMFVSVDIIGKRVKGLFILPREAIRDNDMVYVVKDGKVLVRPVRILRRTGDQIYVKEGIAQGERIITQFPGIATNGMQVRVKTKDASQGDKQ
jgi:RND family efflux transporter MFP subunit